MSSRPRNPALPAMKRRSFPAVTATAFPTQFSLCRFSRFEYPCTATLIFLWRTTNVANKNSLAPRTGFEPASHPFAEGCSPLRYRGMFRACARISEPSG